MIYRTLCIVTLVGVCVLAQERHHHEYRRYTCTHKPNSNGTECALTLKKKRDDDREFKAPVNQGCFEEKGFRGPGVYCPLYCPETGAAYVIAKIPSNNHKCVNLDTYKAENRNGEWFFWRGGKCLEQEMTFEMGCHFLIPPEAADVEHFFKKRA